MLIESLRNNISFAITLESFDPEDALEIGSMLFTRGNKSALNTNNRKNKTFAVNTDREVDLESDMEVSYCISKHPPCRCHRGARSSTKYK